MGSPGCQAGRQRGPTKDPSSDDHTTIMTRIRTRGITARRRRSGAGPVQCAGRRGGRAVMRTVEEETAERVHVRVR